MAIAVKLTPCMAEVLGHAAAGRPLDTGVRGNDPRDFAYAVRYYLEDGSVIRP